MTRYLVEIARQKWQLLSVTIILLLLNLVLAIAISAYQIPALAALQTKWSDLRRQSARAGQADSATLYRQGTADLEKLTAKIPEKREFARVLSDLLEDAASSAVEVGSITYKPVRIKEEQLLAYQVTFAAGGSYAAVKSYLADLQKNPELLVVDSVAFTNNDLFAEHVVMDLHITIYLRGGT